MYFKNREESVFGTMCRLNVNVFRVVVFFHNKNKIHYYLLAIASRNLSRLTVGRARFGVLFGSRRIQIREPSFVEAAEIHGLNKSYPDYTLNI
jgi:hypothetical protein